ncbi:MAG: hypothetical protein KDA61_01390, partial [Planctomycetales bacterium]|nr:hypothetical protein [Planctomycetales bacterium]
MNGNVVGNWSLSLGRWRHTEWRLHVHFPLLAIAASYSAWLGLATYRQASIALACVFVSVLVHELVRKTIAQRMGGRFHVMVMGPLGGWTQPELPNDPPPQLFTALSGPTTYLALAVSVACALTVGGDADTLRLLSPLAPHLSPNATWWRAIGEEMVWVNSIL